MRSVCPIGGYASDGVIMEREPVGGPSIGTLVGPWRRRTSVKVFQTQKRRSGGKVPREDWRFSVGLAPLPRRKR
jgi:hypothetical protein